MTLDLDLATSAIQTQIADPLGVSVEEAAAGIRRVVGSQMADALRETTIGRGHDPREFLLYSYGGAGPTHCADSEPNLESPRSSSRPLPWSTPRTERSRPT